MVRLQRLFLALIIISTIFLVGGGLDFVWTIAKGPSHADLMEKPKATANSPAAMFFYVLGFLGMLFLYWGGKDFNVNQKLSKLRLFVAINLIGASYVGLEVFLRIGFGALF